MKPKLPHLAIPIATAILLTGGSALIFSHELALRDQASGAELASLQSELSGLQAKIDSLQSSFAATAGQDKATEQTLAASIQKVADNSKSSVAKTQDQLLTAAVARTAPAVVSVVISKDVPQLEITYENPFGSDPSAPDPGIRIPVYHQKGIEHQDIGAGTGFLITTNGYILTNRHVVEDPSADYTVLLSTGAEQPAKVVYTDATHDIAILKIAGGPYKKVTLGDSSKLSLGQTVIAIGNALGEYQNSVSTGIISGTNRTITASDGDNTETLNGVLQTDAAINPGNSGGPLVTLSGEVVGVNVATVVGSNNISFSVPIDQAKDILKNGLGI